MTTVPTPAFTGSGGYATSESLNTIKQYSETTITQYDVTSSVQVMFDVRTFNNLIGIQKDADNIKILTTDYYDNTSDTLLTDSLAITASEFMTGINMTGNSSSTSNIVSVGKYTTFYQYFANYIAAYFGLPSPSNPEAQGTSQGMSTLYANEYNFLPNDGVFDEAALLNIMNGNGVVDDTGGYINELLGKIELTGITAALRNAVATNCFDNRNPITGATASDDYPTSNYGVSDGFFDGDVIYIAGGGTNVDLTENTSSDGILLTLKLMIDPVYSSGTVVSDYNITRSLGTSLVIRLKNLSACVLGVTYSSNTSSSLTFNIAGTYASMIIGKSLTNSDYVVNDPVLVSNGATTSAPNNETFVDTSLISGTTYYYTFTPVDINGYTGVKQFVTGKTLDI